MVSLPYTPPCTVDILTTRYCIQAPFDINGRCVLHHNTCRVFYPITCQNETLFQLRTGGRLTHGVRLQVECKNVRDISTLMYQCVSGCQYLEMKFR